MCCRDHETYVIVPSCALERPLNGPRSTREKNSASAKLSADFVTCVVSSPKIEFTHCECCTKFNIRRHFLVVAEPITPKTWQAQYWQHSDSAWWIVHPSTIRTTRINQKYIESKALSMTIIKVIWPVCATLFLAASGAEADVFWPQDKSLLRPQPSIRTRTSFHGRRADDAGYEDEVTKLEEWLMFGTFVMFILAFAFPAMCLAFCKSCPVLCCGRGQLDTDCLPSEIGPIDVSSDYHFMKDVSSTTMGSAGENQIA